tara:strand:- start:116 stop:340 length:225 start_codon:yes stop_codon:yes gene_type:complete
MEEILPEINIKEKLKEIMGLNLEKGACNVQYYANFLSSKNSPRNVRHPTRFRVGEFLRADKKLGERGKSLGDLA